MIAVQVRTGACPAAISGLARYTAPDSTGPGPVQMTDAFQRLTTQSRDYTDQLIVARLNFHYDGVLEDPRYAIR